LESGGLIDEEYRAKPVFELLDKLTNERRRTRVAMALTGGGSASFPGFFGVCEVRLTKRAGKVRLFPLHVRKDEEASWVFTASDGCCQEGFGRSNLDFGAL